MSKYPIRIKPVPYCPVCGAQMKLRRPGTGQTWNPFWGCSTYPDCNGTRNINPDGTPEEDEDFIDDLDDTWHPYHPSNRGDQ